MLCKIREEIRLLDKLKYDANNKRRNNDGLIFPIEKITLKELKKWQKFAENEIVEYKKFIQQIKKN